MTFRTNFKFEQPSRVDVRLDREAERDRQERAVFRAVDQRDGYRCRCCGRRTDPDALSLLRGERHHIVYRSAGGGTTTANLCLLDARCHADEHAHRLKIEGNADQALTFFRRDEQGEYYVVRREVGVRQVERD